MSAAVKHDERRGRAKRAAWFLAAAAVVVYAGVILWYIAGGAA